MYCKYLLGYEAIFHLQTHKTRKKKKLKHVDKYNSLDLVKKPCDSSRFFRLLASFYQDFGRANLQILI